jgi:hypothetical protein
MTTIRIIVRYLFLTDRQLLRLSRWLASFDDMLRCLEPILWAGVCALLIVLYAHILF